MGEIILVRYGEIGLKGGNRQFFEKALQNNIKRALEGLSGVSVSRERGRMYVEHSDSPAEALERIQRVFGVVSVSPTRVVLLDMEAIKARALEEAGAAGCENGRSFKVESRRSNKSFPYTSPEISSIVGGYIAENIAGLTVDVHNPQVVIRIEVRDNNAFVYSRTFRGPGGLPVGTTGKAALMLSGGIDSPVAGWLAMKRGIRLVGVHFHSFPFTSERSKEKVIDLCRILARYGGRFRLYVCPFTDIQRAIKSECPEELYVTIMRRMMFRITERVCFEEKCSAVFTGENLGQVASQTLQSMRVIEDVVRLPVLRPLITMDKIEITNFAKRIGTFDTSILPYDDCCTLFVPKHPATKPKMEKARAAEAVLPDLAEMAEQSFRRSEILTVG